MMVSCSIINPAYPSDKKELKDAEENVKRMGFKKANFFISKNKLFNKWAGEPKERLDLFYNAWNSNDNVVIACKGGSGVTHFVSNIDTSLLENKKLIIGYSDITILLNFLTEQLDIITLHGPNATKKLDEKSISALRDALQMKNYGINFDKKQIMNNPKKDVEGIIIGGNLDRFIEFVNYYPKTDLREKILFLEDINLTEHKIFNRLFFLKNNQYFQPKAILFGGLGIKNKPLMKKMIKYLFPNIPIIMDLPFGHELPNITIPIGAKCNINFEKGKISFLFPESERDYAISFD